MMQSKQANSSGADKQTAKLAHTENGAYNAAQKKYSVLVYTDGKNVGSFYLTLVDSNNQSSKRTFVKKPFWYGFEKDIPIYIDVEKYLGDIVQVNIDKDDTPWYCLKIEVKTPSGKSLEFPCYSWLDKKEVKIREGSARLPQDDTNILRQEELESKKNIFCWTKTREGFPKSLDATVDELPLDIKFNEEKLSHLQWNVIKLGVAKVIDWTRSWFHSLDEIAHFKELFVSDINETPLLVKVTEDWNTDYMFGYQFLNGCNPVMIKKCVNLPEKFPVTHEMVEGFLKRGLTLQEAIEEGNIYITDYEILDGLEGNKKRQNIQYYLTAPICLLYNNKHNQMVPIAIQLSQKPGSPIFLPNDNEYDWTLAKMWVKSSDFNVHQLVTHLLKTHLISEVFAVAMYRQLSTVHPVYKLLLPHVRSTTAINKEARDRLISKDGVFSEISSISAAGIDELMKRAMETCTYKSMCFPEDIKARVMENTPKYYYRDDGMKIWGAINCFVDEVIKIYYDSNETVKKDLEIQEFVKDVSINGMMDSEGKKFPQSLETREELIEYLTVVIFTASAQHAAVNFGQFEWYGYIPNSPSIMRMGHPQEKGTVDLKRIMDTLPDRVCSRTVLETAWALTQVQKEERFLGMYPDMHFTEQPVKEAIMTFRKKLDELTDSIKSRNDGLTMGYCYLSPNKIPNSVAI